jgi:type IV pilus assembly protein PilV
MSERATRHLPTLGQRVQRGVMLLEALIAILIFSIGILAIVGMQAVAIKDVAQSKYRSDASFLAESLLSQMWTDAGNIATYAYAGSGTAPAKLTDWMTQVNSSLPGSTVVPPIVTITGASASGATVQIQVRWRLPEETSQGLPPHNHTIIASVFTS